MISVLGEEAGETGDARRVAMQPMSMTIGGRWAATFADAGHLRGSSEFAAHSVLLDGTGGEEEECFEEGVGEDVEDGGSSRAADVVDGGGDDVVLADGGEG